MAALAQVEDGQIDIVDGSHDLGLPSHPGRTLLTSDCHNFSQQAQ